jgi:hypothetical protein
MHLLDDNDARVRLSKILDHNSPLTPLLRHMHLPTLVYWGAEPPPFLFGCGVALWSIAAFMFITPWWAATNILIVGGINLAILTYIDGTILLVSKLCFYCLLLSIMWLLEPLWTPPSSSASEDLSLISSHEQKSMERAKEPLL